MTRDAKERLFTDLLPNIRMEAAKFVRRNGGSREDATQQAMLRAWMALEHFDESLGFKPWTYIATCVRWQLVNDHRNARNPRRFAGDRPGQLPPNVKDYRKSESQERVLFMEAIEDCTPIEQQMMIRIFYQCETQTAVAESRGISHQRVTNIVNRIKRQLARELSK